MSTPKKSAPKLTREQKRERVTRMNKARTLKALEKHLGVVSKACQDARIGRRTFYEWTNDDPDFAEAVDEIRDVALDEVESHLHEQIRNGNTAATIFYLKCKGKARGYIENDEAGGATPIGGIVFELPGGIRIKEGQKILDITHLQEDPEDDLKYEQMERRGEEVERSNYGHG